METRDCFLACIVMSCPSRCGGAHSWAPRQAPVSEVRTHPRDQTAKHAQAHRRHDSKTTDVPYATAGSPWQDPASLRVVSRRHDSKTKTCSRHDSKKNAIPPRQQNYSAPPPCQQNDALIVSIMTWVFCFAYFGGDEHLTLALHVTKRGERHVKREWSAQAGENELTMTLLVKCQK